MESVIGLVEGREVAMKLRSALIEAGCKEDAVVVHGMDSQDLEGELTGRGLAEARARQYAEAVRKGCILVAAEAERTEKALEVMNRFDLVAPEAMLRGGGDAGGSEEQRARSIEEKVEIGKEQVAGGKRLVTSVTERQVETPLTLHEEAVEVERRGADRALSPEEAGKAFQEEEVEVTATSERPVVSRQARVTGEVVLRKQARDREEVVRETARRQDVDVETIREEKTTAKESRKDPGA